MEINLILESSFYTPEMKFSSRFAWIGLLHTDVLTRVRISDCQMCSSSENTRTFTRRYSFSHRSRRF